jgi:NADH-quinone oxidoreductase subunit H
MSLPDPDAVTWGQALLRVVVLVVKVLGVVVFFMLVRWSWPRFRFDQLMSLAWKVMLPLGLVNLVAVAAVVEYLHGRQLAGEPVGPWLMVAIGWAVAIVGWMAAAWFTPLHSDNRPRMEALAPPEFEPDAAPHREPAHSGTH